MDETDLKKLLKAHRKMVRYWWKEWEWQRADDLRTERRDEYHENSNPEPM